MMLYKNTKVKVCSPDRDADFFDIVARVLLWDTLAPLSVYNLLRIRTLKSRVLIKENGFTLKMVWSRRYNAETTRDVDYADDIALLVNTPDQAESLLHSLEQTAGDIGLYLSVNMYFNWEEATSTLNAGHLKLEDNFHVPWQQHLIYSMDCYR